MGPRSGPILGRYWPDPGPISPNSLIYLVRGWVKTGHFRGIFDPDLDHLPEGYLAVQRALTTNSLIYRSRYWPRTGYLEGQIYP